MLLKGSLASKDSSSTDCLHSMASKSEAKALFFVKHGPSPSWNEFASKEVRWFRSNDSAGSQQNLISSERFLFFAYCSTEKN